jgi:hypothetical protein
MAFKTSRRRGQHRSGPRRLVFAAVVVAVAGCPPKPRGPQPALAGVGCPTAAGVHVASYLAPEEGATGHTGWVLPLHDKVVDSLDGIAGYATIDGAAAASAGVPPPPAELWLMLPRAPPCKLTIGSYYAAAIDAPTKNVTYGVELSGCPKPTEAGDATAIVLASAQAPGRCQIVAPRPVAARLGDTDPQGRWSPPTKATPIPDALAAVVPSRACAAPSCEQLWSIGQIDVGGKPVAWAGAINWLDVTAEPPCTWKVETFSGFFVAGPDGNPVKVTEAQDHPLPLTAVLVDEDGKPEVVLAAGPGEYTVYDYAGGAVTVGRHLVWLIPHPDSFEIDRLGPSCP